MNKLLAYYSLIISAFVIIVCLFDSQGDVDTFIGGLIFIPVVYSIWQMITELKEVEAENKRRDDLRRDEEIRNEVKRELSK